MFYLIIHTRFRYTFIYRLGADIAYSLEDLPEAMDDRNGWRERMKGLRISAQIEDIYKEHHGFK